MIDYLKKIDLMALQILKEQIKHAPVKTIEDKPVHQSEDRSSKRKAPPYAEPERKTADALTLKAELDNVGTQLTSVIAAFHDEDFQRVLPHPVFEELTVRQWLDSSAIMKEDILNRSRKSNRNYYNTRKAPALEARGF